VANNTYSVPTYDKDGNVTCLRLRQSNWQTGTILSQVKKEYDGLGRVIKAHSYNNGNWTTPYATLENTYNNETGNLVSAKDPRGLSTTYEYDALSRLLKTTEPRQTVGEQPSAAQDAL
jgi:YD repeat-containing protein